MDDRENNSALEKQAIQPEGAAALSDDWYLLAYNPPGQRKERSFWQGKKLVGLAAIVAALGCGATAFELSLTTAPRSAALGEPAFPPSVQAQTTSLKQPQQQPVLASKAQIPASVSTQQRTAGTVPRMGTEELARLKARNRRLEALILVLRQRAHAPEKRQVPEQTSVIGQ